MRMINRTTKIDSTKDRVVTTIVERIVENEAFQLASPDLSQAIPPQDVQLLKCNICTEEFDLTAAPNARCPACGSRDISLT